MVGLWKKKKKNLTSKVSNGWLKNLGFNPCLHQKSIDALVW